MYRSKKRERTTEICFNEYDKKVSIITYNTDLKKRLFRYSDLYPAYCKLLYDDGNGCVEYEILKDRLSLRLLPPCSDNRRETARGLMKKINSGGEPM